MPEMSGFGWMHGVRDGEDYGGGDGITVVNSLRDG